MSKIVWIVLIAVVLGFLFLNKDESKVESDVYKKVEKKSDKVYTLNLKTTPSDSKIKILNIVPKFRQGIRLKEGKYQIEVSKSGYKTYKKWINISKNVYLTVKLDKKEEKKVVKKAPKVSKWIDVKVPLVDGGSHIYQVTKSAIDENSMISNGKKSLVKNITATDAENFCIKSLKGNLISFAVFESAKNSSKISSLNGTTNREFVVPYDEEDDEHFKVDLENTPEVMDSELLIYYWDKKRYRTAPSVYKNKKLTFRCMKIK